MAVTLTSQHPRQLGVLRLSLGHGRHLLLKNWVRMTTLAYICFPPASRQIEIEGDSELIEGPHVFPESFPRELP